MIELPARQDIALQKVRRERIFWVLIAKKSEWRGDIITGVMVFCQ